jgi:hypothetical protein
MINETHHKIKEFTTDIADQMGINLSKITLVEGNKVGCLDIHLLNLSTKGKLVSVLAYQSDVDNLLGGKPNDRFETKIRTALSRLKIMLESPQSNII